MLASFPRDRLAAAGPRDLSDELERGRIVHFPECPIEIPSPGDLDFMRLELPKFLRYKNISFHPEADKINGLKDPVARKRICDILRAHSVRVQSFLRKSIPALAENWQVGTSSFRPLQEQGRNLDSHASNERVHVDAGAYGATHGNRVFRFFVNVNPTEDRVWITKGAFPDLVARYGDRAGILPPRPLDEGPLDRLRTGTLRALSTVNSQMMLLDSSPYDRAMRRFHNFMKDTPEVQADTRGHQEIRFKPLTAWMVFTDMVSHACTSGQFALVDTFVLPLANCRLLDLAPINILKGRAGDAAAAAS